MALDPKAARSKIQRDRRVERSRKDRFTELISTPASLPLPIPEAGVLGISCSAPVSQGQLIITSSTGRTLGTPNLEADEIWRFGFFEKGVEIDVTAAPAGTVSLHYLDDRRDAFVIATGTFP
jgi:hypothetical protein